MRLVPYLASTTACFFAYAALAFIAHRDRMAWPLLFATWSAVLCFVAGIGMAQPVAFLAEFYHGLVPAMVVTTACFATVELIRFQLGCPAEETLMAAALVIGVAISFIAGATERPGYLRLALQTLAVVVPIAIVLASVGARPLPEFVPEPQIAVSPYTAMPVPEVAQ